MEAKFIFNDITTEIENLIRNAKKDLLLISPFIDLSPNIIDLLKLKIEEPNFQLRILYGKNKNYKSKSIKDSSLEFLKSFPNVEIKYNERIHAKFYKNDHDFIVTSMNLYNYSLDKNIEVGMMGVFNESNLLSKAVDVGYNALDKGVKKVIGGKEELDPVETMEEVYKNAELLFKAEAVLTEKKGILSTFSKVKIEGRNILKDLFIKEEESTRNEEIISISQQVEVNSSSNKYSLSKISKMIGIDSKTLLEQLETEGYIRGGEISEKGISSGLEMKKYMGNDYIAYPEDLHVFK